MDMRCPKCGSENTTKIPIELLGGIKDIWYMLLFVSLIGGTISPICWIFCFVCMIIIFITNLLRKIAYRNEWIMQCSRCGTEFTIVNPDKIDKINSKKIIEQGKINDKIKLRKECLLRNGMLNDDEVLKGEINYFGFHKNLFSNSNGKLKVTDKAIICYNEAGSFRISKEKIIVVKKKNYFFFIPTGIQIKVDDKRKKYKFVVMPKERNQIIELISSNCDVSKSKA